MKISFSTPKLRITVALFYPFWEQVNQIGSVTESIEAVRMSKKAGWGVMASHRRFGHKIWLDSILVTVYHVLPFSHSSSHWHGFMIMLQWRNWGHLHRRSFCWSGHGNYILPVSHDSTFITIWSLNWSSLFIAIALARVKLRQELHAGQSVLPSTIRLTSPLALHSCTPASFLFSTSQIYWAGIFKIMFMVICSFAALAYWRGAWLGSCVCWCKIPGACWTILDFE